MRTSLDILMIESSPGAAEATAAVLATAGHRLHRCHREGDRGFPCRGVHDPSSCPVEQGVDVAVVVRPHVMPRPTVMETGVSCVLRAGVPLVERGRDALDPFGPWLAARVGVDDDPEAVVEACTLAADTVPGSLVARVRQAVATTMTALAPSRGPVGCTIRRQDRGLQVTLSGPRIGKEVEHALAVSVAAALRAEARPPFTVADIGYRANV